MYRSHYRLDLTGLHDNFKTRYFKLMEDARKKDKFDLREIAANLGRFKRLKGDRSLQFSFLTKLAATVDSSFPLYDKEVGTAVGVRPPSKKEGGSARLRRSLDYYGWLRDLYTQLLSRSKGRAAIKDLKAHYPRAKSLPPTKALDFLLWQAGKLDDWKL